MEESRCLPCISCCPFIVRVRCRILYRISQLRSYLRGAYIEVQSTLGRGSLVFPSQYQNNTFGFSGSGLNLCNITYSTVSGYFYPASGSPVQVRFQRYNTLEYYYENGSWGNEWRPVTTSAIYNTNVRFIDNTTLTRAQEGPIFDDGQRTMIPLVIVLLLVAVIGICLGFRRK